MNHLVDQRLVDRLLDSPQFGERWADIGWTLLATLIPTDWMRIFCFVKRGDIAIG